ncbi:MAG: DUF2917 domain-containing protein [Caldimonas sp.]
MNTLRAGHVLALGSAGGRLAVLHGRVWWTRSGDLDDHVVEAGQAVRIPPSGHVLVENWGDAEPALVAWQPGTRLERARAVLGAGFARARRNLGSAPQVCAGLIAAVAALAAGAMVFGPYSDSLTYELATAPRLHNSVVVNSGAVHSARARFAAGATQEHFIDAGAGSQARARTAAQEAHRRSASPA